MWFKSALVLGLSRLFAFGIIIGFLKIVEMSLEWSVWLYSLIFSDQPKINDTLQPQKLFLEWTIWAEEKKKPTTLIRPVFFFDFFYFN